MKPPSPSGKGPSSGIDGASDSGVPRKDAPESPISADDRSCRLIDCVRGVRRGRPSVAEAEQLYGKILEASWQVLLDVGFDAFTFDRVARHAHIGKATIYSRFAGKRELMEALLHHGMNKRRALIEAQVSELDFAACLKLRAVETLELLCSPDGKLMERLIDWLDGEADSPQGGYRAYVYRSALDSIGNQFEQARARGEIAMEHCEDAARFWLEALLGHYKMISSEADQIRARHESWAERYIAFFVAGASGQQSA